jgi:hypothetical protein
VSKAETAGRKTPEPVEEKHSAEESTANGGLVRITVNLTPGSHSALERASRATGDSKTDTINRALRVYALVQELVERDGGSLCVLHEDGKTERIYLL